jgi:citrate lyase subunit beta/citryl-CoA lyase
MIGSMRSDLGAARTLLFVPGTRPDRFASATASGADLVIVDLEDAVPPELKADARAQVAAHLAGGGVAAVRINAIDTPWHREDLEAVAGRAVALVVPKAEPGAALRDLASGATPCLALVETAVGVLGAAEVALTPGVVRLAFGSLDLAAELAVDPADRPALEGARSMLVLASAAARLPGPVDGVYGDLTDAEGLRVDAAHGRRTGFAGKLCVHPRQVPVVAEAFGLSMDEVAWATRVLAAAVDGGVVVVDGQMVDKPVLDRARRVLDG